MEQGGLLQKQHKMLHHLCCLPRKIISLAGMDNITEFLLHDLCHEHCFNLKRAAYLVDNPDFDCLKGIAGFSRDEPQHTNENIWSSPEEFSNHMKKCQFNNKVRSITGKSRAKKGQLSTELIQDLSDNLGFQSGCFSIWDMKHHNHGLFIYEKSDVQDCAGDDYLLNGLSLFSFCPIF